MKFVYTIHTFAAIPPTKILFGITVPNLGALEPLSGVPHGVVDGETSVDVDCKIKLIDRSVVTRDEYHSPKPYRNILRYVDSVMQCV